MRCINTYTMKNHLHIIAPIIAIFLSGMLTAQVNVYRVSGGAGQPSGDGAFYTLPRTVLKIDVVVKATEQLKGPYSDYAERFLGLEEVNKFDFTTWTIEDIEVATLTEPDPVEVYYVESAATDSRDLRMLSLSLDEAGMLLSAGDLEKAETKKTAKTREVVFFENPSEGMEYPDFYASRHVETRIDTIIRRVTVDTLMEEQLFYRQRLEDNSDEEMAVKALQKIQQIRESKYNLITGFQETAYDPGSIKYMFERLDHLENEYLDLFRGKSFSEFYHHTFYVVPQPKNNRYSTTLFQFATGSGITKGKSGEPVQLELAGTGTTGDQAGTSGTGIAYRVPGTVEVSVNLDDQTLYENRMTINQFGVVNRLPAKRFRAEFNPETGGLKSVYIERGER